ncbi:MAG: 30S ribosomal protein S16 [Lentimicrobiaceae bacterium]|jgi:small subunit ribosomal protein S16|nr:30S ribosomal protein S16 [Lentimicrobiaceae bacterium]
MPTKIRLQRFGKKGMPFFHIVIADGRAPRDGKFIEKIGSYNPIAKPAEVQIDFEKAIQWIRTGAQPTETVRTILSQKGVLLKVHLQKGVEKGAMTQEQADVRFKEWVADKESKLISKAKENELKTKEEKKKRFEAEAKINEAKAQAIAKKYAAKAAAEKAEKEEASATEEVAPAANEEPAAEEPAQTE